MNYLDISALLTDKLSAAKEKILEKAPQLTVTCLVTYMNDSVDEYEDFREGTTAIIGNISVSSSETPEDRIPSFAAVIDLNAKNAQITNPAAAEKELLEFEKELEGFVDRLANAEDKTAFLDEEFARIEAEGERMVEELERSVKKYKRIAVAGTCCLALLLIILTVIGILI